MKPPKHLLPVKPIGDRVRIRASGSTSSSIVLEMISSSFVFIRSQKGLDIALFCSVSVVGMTSRRDSHRPCDTRARKSLRRAGTPTSVGVTAGAAISSGFGENDLRMKEFMMRVFVAGAAGGIGKQLVPRVVAEGHEVVGMTHSESKRALLRELGAEPVVADALDPDQVAEAVARARPEVIVHELTAIGSLSPRHFDRDFALTNRLR